MSQRVMNFLGDHILLSATLMVGAVFSANYLVYRRKRKLRRTSLMSSGRPEGEVSISTGALEDLVFGAVSYIDHVRITGVRLQRSHSMSMLVVEGKVLSGGNIVEAEKGIRETAGSVMNRFVQPEISGIPVQVHLDID